MPQKADGPGLIDEPQEGEPRAVPGRRTQRRRSWRRRRASHRRRSGGRYTAPANTRSTPQGALARPAAQSEAPTVPGPRPRTGFPLHPCPHRLLVPDRTRHPRMTPPTPPPSAVEAAARTGVVHGGEHGGCTPSAARITSRLGREVLSCAMRRRCSVSRWGSGHRRTIPPTMTVSRRFFSMSWGREPAPLQPRACR
jgi:hypothetical protein